MSQAIDTVRVVVTGVGGGGFGEQILKALRLAPTNYEVVGTDTSVVSKGFAAVQHRYVVPLASDSRYIDVMLNLCRKHRIQALFAGSEPEIRALAGKRRLFEAAGVFLFIQPDSVLDVCFDKVKTTTFLAERGFGVPRTWRIDSPEHLHDIDVFPVVLKPYENAGGSSDVNIAQDRDELVAFGRSLLINGRRIVAQEYVGVPELEFTVGVLCSVTGDVIQSIALRRFTTSSLGCRLKVPNRTGRTELGDMLVISSGISQGEIGPFPDVAGVCERIAVALGAHGPINIQCRLVDHHVVVFEINPRFSGTTSVRALVGYNEPDVMVAEQVLRRPVARRFAYDSGIVLRGLEETFVTQDHVATTIDLR